MRHFAVMCGMLALLLVTPPLFAGDFEGVIHMKSIRKTDETQAHESDWFIKGDNIRMERRRSKDPDATEAKSMGAMIFNADKKTRIILMPDRKMYMEHSVEGEVGKAAELLKDMKYEIVRTGKTDRVAGYTCEIFLNKNKETGKITGESCAAKGLANMGGVMGLNRSDAEKLSGEISRETRQILKEGFFILRMVTREDDGSEKMRMETTSVEKKRIDSGLFVPPAGYVKYDMDAMMQQRKKAMQEGGQGGPDQSGKDFQQMMQEMQKRKAEGGGAAGGQGGGGTQQPDMNDLMKQFGDMMKKKQDGQ